MRTKSAIRNPHKLPSWIGGVAAASADGVVDQQKSEFRNPQSAIAEVPG